MSRENVEIVRRLCEAFVGGDVETAFAGLDPAVEWHGTVGGLDQQRVYRGHDEVVAAFVENFENWEQPTLAPERFIDAGDRVVVLWHEIARSRHSDQELETRTGVVYTVHDGLIVEVRGYMDRDQALASVGATD
jgi:ketosteroid isomerase-like protein